MKHFSFFLRRGGIILCSCVGFINAYPASENIYPNTFSNTLQSRTTQEKEVFGTIVDASTGEVLVGVNIRVKNTDIGTVSDMDGKFTISVNQGAELIFSYIGYKETVLKIGNQNTIKVPMLADNEMLDEVVVVGYGSQKKVSVTGAVASISGDDIKTSKTPSLMVALQGKIPGLVIRQNNGAPGAFDTNIRVRCMGEPMYVIDGVVRNDGSEFQRLNPEDIESISLLKDGAAAIYGINSQNGVIIVKTKTGNKGPVKVSYDGSVGFSKPTRVTEMMNSSQYWDIRNEDSFFSTGTPYFSSREALQEYQALPSVDWYSAVFKKSAFQHQHNVKLEGGNDRIQSYASLGFMTDNGLLQSGDIGYNKLSFRSGTTIKINDRLSVDLILSGFTDLRKQPGTWNGAFFYLNKATNGTIPSETIYANNNPNYFNRPMPLNDNPVQFADRDVFGYREWRTRLFQSTVGVNYAIPYVPGLKIRLQGAYDNKGYTDTKVQKRCVNYTYSASNDTYSPSDNYNPSISDETTNTTRVNMQGQLIYHNEFNKKHFVDMTAVIEAREDNSRYIKAYREYEGDFFTIDNIDRAPTNGQQTSGWTDKITLLSVIGKFSYDYAHRYMVEFAFREDGSYRYAPDQRWGFFPVVSAGWRISEESFIKGHTDIVTNLKLRGSYGVSGEDAGNPFQYLPSYTGYNGYVISSDGKFTNGFTNSGLVNRELTWVTSKTINLGVDLTLWDGKLDFSADIYRRDREGLLTTRANSLPNTFGASLPQENLNSDRNQGFEFMIGHSGSVNDFRYSVSGNMNIGRWQVIYSERAPFKSSYDRWRNSNINRWGDIGWGYKVIGQYQNYDQIRNGVIETTKFGNSKTLPGDYIHQDTNGDGVINDKDQLPDFFTGQPKLNFGINFNASYKGFDFTMLWQGAGMYSLRYGEILGEVLANNYANSPSFYYDRWHLEDIYDPNSEWIPGKYPAARRTNDDNGANRLESDIRRVNATYLRLKNAELGYTFPKGWLKGTGLSNLRLYVNCFNPFVICNSYLRNFDPEIVDGNGFQYPLQKSYNFGVNLTF